MEQHNQIVVTLS